MAIEFDCPNCGSVLQVDDSAAGKSALCPKCEQVSSVPTSTFSSSSADSPPGSPERSAFDSPDRPSSEPHADVDSINPFAPPTYQAVSPEHVRSPEEIRPTHVEIGDILSFSIQIWKDNFGILLGATAIMVFTSMILTAVAEGASGIIAAAGDDDIAAIVGGVLTLLENLVELFLNIGMTTIALSLCRGHQASINLLFSGGDRLLPVVGTSILAFIAVIFGLALLIVPGLALLVLFWPYYYLIVDKHCPAMESFSHAFSFAKLNVGTSILLAILSFVIMLIGFMAFCVGIFAAIPLVSVMWTAAYLMMKGEIVAQPAH